jgi:hypothetical protein
MMMTMTKKAPAWILAVTVALLAALPGVARATADSWVSAGCATGSFDPVTLDPQGHYLVPAHMTLCEPYQARFAFSLVLFHPDGTLPIARDVQLRHYAATGPAEAIADVHPAVAEPVFGLCLMRDVDTRVACARVDTAADGTATSTPIPVGDHLVAEQVMFSGKSSGLQPNYCASCVSMY